MKEDDLLKIESTIKKIFNLCKDALGQNQRFELVKYGSAVNGLSVSGEDGSDLDLILVVTQVLNDDLQKQMMQEKNILEIIRREIIKERDEYTDVNLFPATFGHLLQFKD